MKMQHRMMLFSFFLLFCSVFNFTSVNSEKLVYASSTAAAGHELLKAAEAGDVELVMGLLEVDRVDLNTRNNYGVSAIIFAANNGHNQLVRRLLDFDANIDDRSNNWKTPLLWASLWGHYEVVQTLVKKGANISVYDYQGLTPVMSATISGNLDIVKYLVNKGADVTAKNFFNGTALSIAIGKKDQKMINFLRPFFPSFDDNSPFHALIYKLWEELVKILNILWIFIQSLKPKYLDPFILIMLKSEFIDDLVSKIDN